MYNLTSTATEQDKREDGDKFPMLMKGESSGDTYIVTGVNGWDYTGTRLVSTNPSFRVVGEHNDGLRALIPYYGTVTLKGSEV